MRVHRIQREPADDLSYILLDDEEQPIQVVSGFMSHLHARGFSPNTQAAYAYDLLHFMSFLKQRRLTYLEFTPTHALDLLAYLRAIPSRRQGSRLSIVLCTTEAGQSTTHLSAASINRILAAVSSFYEYLILSGRLIGTENPIQKVNIRQLRGFLSDINLSWVTLLCTRPFAAWSVSRRFSAFPAP